MAGLRTGMQAIVDESYFTYYLLKSIFQSGWGVPIVDQNYSFLHMKGPLENVEVGDIILKRWRSR